MTRRCIGSCARRLRWGGWTTGGRRRTRDLPLDSADSAKVALDVARGAIVLLKNDKAALPLDRAKVKNIVVIGPNATAGAEAAFGGGGGRTRGGAGAAWAAVGGAAGPANMGGGGSGAVVPFPAHAAEADYFPGDQEGGGGGCDGDVPAGDGGGQCGGGGENAGRGGVKAADAVIVCVGLNRNSESEGRDRAGLSCRSCNRI